MWFYFGDKWKAQLNSRIVTSVFVGVVLWYCLQRNLVSTFSFGYFKWADCEGLDNIFPGLIVVLLVDKDGEGGKEVQGKVRGGH